MTCNHLKKMSSLDVPGVYFIRVKCSRKYDLSIIIKLKTDKLTVGVCSENSEFLLLQNIISVDSAIETT